MKRTAGRAVTVAVLSTLAFILAILFGLPVGPGLLRLYLVLICGVGVAAFVAALDRIVLPAGPSPFEQALHRRPAVPPDRPQALTDLEGIVAGGMRAGAVHFRLRPVLREIAAVRLRSAYGVDLDTNPVAARRRLDPELWEVVRPDREPPDDRFAPGLSLPALQRIVEGLERVE